MTRKKKRKRKDSIIDNIIFVVLFFPLIVMIATAGISIFAVILLALFALSVAWWLVRNIITLISYYIVKAKCVRNNTPPPILLWDNRIVYTWNPDKYLEEKRARDEEAAYLNKTIAVPTNPYEYEHYCAKLLKAKGYKKVSVTRASGDYGADIICFNERGEKYVFQCKLYNQKVGLSPVQQAVTAKAHYGATKAGVITTLGLSQAAENLAKENDVTVITTGL